MRRLIILVCAFLGGCETVGTVEQPDAYINAAVSWEGAQIRDMISVWGQPNAGLVEPSKYRSGTADWKYVEEPERNPYAAVDGATKCDGNVSESGNVQVDCESYDKNAIARRQYERASSIGDTFLARCSFTASFDETGEILKVQGSSYYCKNVMHPADSLTYQGYED